MFQKTLTEISDGLPGVQVYDDDILIWGSTRREHEARLRAALQAAEQAGLTFSPAKCTIGVEDRVSWRCDQQRWHQTKAFADKMHATDARAGGLIGSPENAGSRELFRQVPSVTIRTDKALAKPPEARYNV